MSQAGVVERVRSVRGVSYAWRPGEEHRARSGVRPPRELGVIAQEVEAVFPEAAGTNADGLKQVDYAGLVAVLIEAVKELDDRVQRLESGAEQA